MSDDFASILFPNDAPKAPQQAQPSAGVTAPQARPAEPSPAEAKGDEPDPAALFDTEARPGDAADYDGCFEPLEDLAFSLKLSGEGERSSQLVEATDIMFEQALQWGTPPETMREISGYLHEAAGTMGELSPEAIADGEAKALRELGETGVTNEDLAIARSMVKTLEGRIPNIHDQLERSGLGNNVNFIRTLIAEGKRRAASVRR